MVTVVSRKIRSIPYRSAEETWITIADLLCPDKSAAARNELDSVVGIACSLIVREYMQAPIVVYGSGPRLRMYCIYGDEALDDTDMYENPLAFEATGEGWKMSLPCGRDDLSWVKCALEKISSIISVRDMEEDPSGAGLHEKRGEPVGAGHINMKAFFRQ